MFMPHRSIGWVAAGAACVAMGAAGTAWAGDWPQWRGPAGTGSAPDADPPSAWSETNNVLWKVPIPGAGNASPVVWSNRIIVLTALETDRKLEAKSDPDEAKLADWQKKMRTKPVAVMRFDVICVDLANGNRLWSRTATEAAPHEPRHQDGSWASGSAVTDGEYVLAYFGSQGLYAYDMDGAPKWHRNLGKMVMRNSFGEGSTPTLHGDMVVVVCDHEGKSFVTALDRRTGTEKWRAERDEISSWATPVVTPVGERLQVLVSATGKIRSYDLLTGEMIWQCGGMTTNVIPTPAVAQGMAYFASGFRGASVVAIKLAGASGDLTGTGAVAWTYRKNAPYVPSPLVHRGNVYMLKINEHAVTCLDAATGAVKYGPAQLEGLKGVYASPVGAGDRIYITGRNGVTSVLKAGDKFSLVATNSLDDGFTASAAVVDRFLILRGYKNLYCLGEK